MTIQKLKEEVKKLTPYERILFIRYVLDTIAAETDEEDGVPLSDEWKKELEIRSDAYKEGETKTRSWEEVKEKLIRKHS